VLTTTSSAPAWSNSARTESSSVTSTVAALCGSPSSVATERAPSALRSATITRQPSLANALATALPMPEAPPTTTAVR